VSFEYASWSLPAGVYAGWTTRRSGVSTGMHGSNNIALHVGDEASAVAENRAWLRSSLIGQPDICWLNQTHSTVVVDIVEANPYQGQDGSHTQRSGIACAVMTADCLPVFLWSSSGTRIAAVHAGWRGLAQGILLNALTHFVTPEQVVCGIGPAISVSAFEVGEDVRSAFAGWPDAGVAFKARSIKGKYWCDLPMLAEAQLRQAGVSRVYQSSLCTFQDNTRFYSYRRDGQTGRMANLIWKV
jgi:polyphenol oxidase